MRDKHLGRITKIYNNKDSFKYPKGIKDYLENHEMNYFVNMK